MRNQYRYWNRQIETGYKWPKRFFTTAKVVEASDLSKATRNQLLYGISPIIFYGNEKNAFIHIIRYKADDVCASYCIKKTYFLKRVNSE